MPHTSEAEFLRGQMPNVTKAITLECLILLFYQFGFALLIF